MKNNNQPIVRKITGRALRVNVKRNFFITTAIALTAFMIASVFSVGMGYYRTVAISPFRFEGTRAHMGMIGHTPQQMEALRSLDYVRHIGLATPVTNPVGTAYLPGFETGVTMIYMDQANWDHFATPAFTRVAGRYATGPNDIMLSRYKLEAMGISNPIIGMEIPIDFTIYGSDEIFSETFTLSAFYTEFVSVSPCARMPVFVSRAFAEAHGRYRPENMSVTILFPNNRNALAYANRLVRELGLDAAQYQIHPAVLAGADINTTTMYLIMGILVAFVMFVGFLLIYNVLFVSVSKDVRFYGLLKTLGTTPRQLRRIVNGQVLRLCAVGLPIGLGLAALTSLALVPAFLTGFNAGVVISFSPLIYVGGAVFTLLTAYVSAFTSAKKAARVSPIEAIRYTGEGQVQVKARTSANETAKRFCTSYLARLILKPRGKPWRMAWRNVFRQRKQAAVVLLSLFLGVTVYMTVMTVVFGFDIDNELDTWHTHDFAVTSRNFGALTEDMVRDMAAIPGVTQLNPTTITAGQLPALAIPAIENAVPPRPAQTPFGSVYGIDTATLLLLDGDTDMDIAAFERGEIVLLESRALRLTRPDTVPGLAGNNLLQVGDTVDILLGRGGEFLAENVTVGGHIYNLAHVSTVSGGYAPISLIMSNVFLQQHVQDLAADRIKINVAPGMDSQVNGLLTALVGQSGNIRSRYEARQAMEDARVMMFVLGVGISAVLGVIGIFNFINVITVGLLVRRREFAALESVGMSRKQMRAMLRWEGAVYWMVTVAASLTAGTAVAYGLFALLRSASPSQFPVFHYPLVAVLVAYGLIVVACSVVPEAAYKSMSKQTLVERLREAE